MPFDLTDPRRVAIARVPASTSNLGPGFDCLGLALSLFSSVALRESPDGEDHLEIRGRGADQMPATSENLIFKVAVETFQLAGREAPSLSIRATNRSPISRGLGSSATAMVAGAIAANTWMGEPIPQSRLFEWLVEREGHPDNVSASMFGGQVVTIAESEPLAIDRAMPHESLRWVAVIPDYELNTNEMRGLLPVSIRRQDAVFNASRLALLLGDLAVGRLDRIPELLRDRLHEPFRRPKIREFDALEATALEHGATAMFISGSGPTTIALCHASRAAAVASALERGAATVGLVAEVMTLRAARHGARSRILKVGEPV